MAGLNASLDSRYRLRDSVRVRCEAFGALLYDGESEALYVVRPAAATALLRKLDGKSTLREVVSGTYQDDRSFKPSLALVERLMDWGIVDEV